MKICIIVGTRPEVIKVAPIITACQALPIDFFIIHSNQHYSKEMDAIFFEELNLPAPKYNLNVGSGKHSNQIGNILIRIEPILELEKPDIVLVQGDTNTVLAGGLAAQKLGIKVAHLEAGLRSYDRTMPEETNRVVVDHLSDYLFAVTSVQQESLIKEGCAPQKIHVVGNSIVDALFSHIAVARQKSQILQKLLLTDKNYFLVTAHRAANVDRRESLVKILSLLEYLISTFAIPVVWPIHPRTKRSLQEYKLNLPSEVRAIEPLGYLDFLKLTAQAKAVLTDSGGIQEECCILKVPCLTLRENTERPETLSVGANILVGLEVDRVRTALDYFLVNEPSWSNPFGMGNTAELVLDILLDGQSCVAKKNDSIAVVGLGYMGLPMAGLLCEAGYDVTGVDINIEKVDQINLGMAPFEEEGMPALLKSAIDKGFRAYTTLSTANVYIISVPTPSVNTKCDLSYVIRAFENVLLTARDGTLIIIESTIKPKTCSDMLLPMIKETGKNILLAHCPERAIPGNTLHELLYNDRVVGGIDSASTDAAYKIYASFCKGKVIKTDATTAECIKLVENTFRDVNIAFANELDELLLEYGVDTNEVISVANRHPRVNILSPGPGVGGHCIAVDPWFLVEDTKNGALIRTARKINDDRPAIIVSRANSFVNKFGTNVGILGLAYKKNVDDCRESPAFQIIKLGSLKGWNIKAFDPEVKNIANLRIELTDAETLEKWSDFLILVTDHDVFKKYKFNKPILDTRNFFK